MAGKASGSGEAIGKVMAVVREFTLSHLRDWLGLMPEPGEACRIPRDRMPLRDVTSVMGIGGDVNAYVAMAFDRALIDWITAVEIAGLDVPDMDRQALCADTAGELVNTVAGKATAHLASGGRPLSLTPPVALADPNALGRDRDSICWTVKLATGRGCLDLTVLDADPPIGGMETDTGDAG